MDNQITEITVEEAIQKRAQEIVETVERTINRELTSEEKTKIFEQVEKEFNAQDNDWMLIKDADALMDEIAKAKELISMSIKEMISSENRLQFFGEFGLLTRFVPSNDKSLWLAAITLTKRGPMCFYNPVNIQKLTKKQLRFLLIHEFLHVLYRHGARRERFDYNQMQSNIAMDMVINTRLMSGEFRDVEFIDGGVTLPDEYKNEPLVFEHILKLLQSNKKCQSARELAEAFKLPFDSGQKDSNCKGGGDNNGNGNGRGSGKADEGNQPSNGGGKGLKSKGLNDNGESLDSHGKIPRDVYGNCDIAGLDSDDGLQETDSPAGEGAVDIDQYNVLVSELLNKIKHRMISRSKTRGLDSGLESMLDEFEMKPKKKWSSPIKRDIRSWLGAKSQTYQRPNRRGILGLKGKMKFATYVNIILDSSGSMFNPEDMKEVFSVFSFDSCIINLVQIDTKIRDFKTIPGKKLKDLKIKGGGGTVIQPAFDFLIQKGLNKYPTLLLTDGYTDNLDLSQFTYVTTITSSSDVPIAKMPSVRYKQFRTEKTK